MSLDLDVLQPASITGDSGRVQIRLRSSEAITSAGASDRSAKTSTAEGGLSPSPERLVWVSLYLSTDARLDSGDTLLARRQVRLSGAGGKAFTLDYSTVGLEIGRAHV